MIELLGQLASSVVVAAAVMLWSLAAIIGWTQSGANDLALIIALLVGGLVVAAMGWLLRRATSATPGK